ncbi:type I restriction enzyme subunit R domain-containing protein [Mycoplasmopsis felifaucium]|uniref:type I restriction enzyme subunit R domain-containing protein n=1 Tax=Mycoplasmopsis felifaucium TaxID=35768 RepID=UPI00055F0043|nr:DEAD/DEAH box helicase family protein [Mycoplasmopsis felifaucium]
MYPETFNNEQKFEDAVVEMLTQYGWESNILKNLTEEDIFNNWLEIIYNNNKGIDRLNDVYFSDGEKKQLRDKLNNLLGSSFEAYKQIIHSTITIKRDNPKDKLHLGTEVSLELFDKDAIAGGKSKYQIVRQPRFTVHTQGQKNRRGDLLLLINGLPLIHIELKKSGVSISEAINQIQKYSKAGVFTGIFSLVQVFVAMNPEETKYFANPGRKPFNEAFMFKWADKENKPFDSYKDVIKHLLSIPMAHKLVGYYTIADNGDKSLKVMRSYQCYAAEAILDRVKNALWTEKDHLGGYIWHTTGSGKTFTSFKTAQLIKNSNKADKIVFIMDRSELWTQSYKNYIQIANDDEIVSDTDNSYDLIRKLKNKTDKLIVTSIHKMSKIQSDGYENEGDKINKFQADIDKINEKKLVFIIDECHRSNFGEMHKKIKDTFPKALYFGFTGTPIFDENSIKMNTTADVFGDELHRYSIADGIRDENVLGFDPYKVFTFDDMMLRKAIAFEKCKTNNIDEIYNDESKYQIYNQYVREKSIPMVGYIDELTGKKIDGIEDMIPNSQYAFPNEELKISDPAKYEYELKKSHPYQVVKSILSKWNHVSDEKKFHGLLAVSSIPDAIQYFKLFKYFRDNNDGTYPEIKFTALFSLTDDNKDGWEYKEDAVVEILEEYKNNFGILFHPRDFDTLFKSDLLARLAHKIEYFDIDKEDRKSQQIDLVIVVDQLLTGYDSKWINALYLDKTLQMQNIIQAFSRTNRIFGNYSGKPYGVIKFYRRPHKMDKEIDIAFKTYSGFKPQGIFVPKLQDNLKNLNDLFCEIKSIFERNNIENFETVPADIVDKRAFVKTFNQFSKFLEAAKVQGFNWNKNEYNPDNSLSSETVKMNFDENDYRTVFQRYKSLATNMGTESDQKHQIAYDIASSLLQIDTGLIDVEYCNKFFNDWYLSREKNATDKELISKKLQEFKSVLKRLSDQDSEIVKIIIQDIESGKTQINPDYTLLDYINNYKEQSTKNKINEFACSIGIKDVDGFIQYIKNHNMNNYNEKDAFSLILNPKNLDQTKAKDYFIKNNKWNKSDLVMLKAKEEIYNFCFIDNNFFDKKD